MGRSSKRPKPNDYYERGGGRAGSVSSEQDGLRHECQGIYQHSGKGVQNANGIFSNGRDFHMPHLHDNNILIIPQTPTPTDSSTTINKEEHRRVLIESLKFAQINSRQTNIKKAHGETCKWFLETTQYIEWLDANEFENHDGLLWVKGKPGVGKSTLMKFTFSHVHQTFEKKRNIILSFFNARGEELEKSTVGLYRSLLSQLLETRRDLQRVLDPVELRCQWHIGSLESKLEEALCLMGKCSIYCIIVALDECEEQSIRSMLRFLQRVSRQAFSTGARLHVCLASRHYPHITIERGLNIIVEGREEHQRDIADYLDAELHIGCSSLAEQIRSSVREKASGVFMWVVLVVDILNKEYDRGRTRTLYQRLQDIPSDLHDLIYDILTRDNDNMHGLLLFIQWVLFAKRPLTPKELYFAIMSGLEPECLFACDLEVDLSADDIQRYVIDNSKGLAESTKADIPTIQFIHESIKDFLLKENGLQKIWPELESNLRGKSHNKLKGCCLAYMNNNIAKDFFLPNPLPKANSRKAANLRRDVCERLPFLEYANQHVLYHADRAESDRISQREFLEAFTAKKHPSAFADSELRSLSLETWQLYNNLFETYQSRRYIHTPSLLYIY